MPSAYHPDFGSVVNYRLQPLPESPDGQVRWTVREILSYIHQDAKSPFIQNEARKMVELGNGDPNVGLWRLIKPQMRFKRDEAIAADLRTDIPAEDVIETIIRPIDQWLLINVLKRKGVGDCDCFHCYGACLLYALGVPCSFVTISADDEVPDQFSHIYLASYWNGVRTPLDLSHGPYPGWEAPNLGRLKEWPVEITAAGVLFDGALVLSAAVGAYFGLRWLDRRAA